MKPSGPIEHVSDTSFWIAAYRARETERKDALFRDPLAGVLAADRGPAIADRMGNSDAMAWTVALRTFVIDAFILEAIAGGVDTVLNLGAGLDTRPYRLELPESLRWIEVDFPGVISYKTLRLSGEPPKCDLERIALDLANVEERERLFGAIAARAKKVLVLTEGVVPYLSNDDVASLAASLLEQRNFKYWITDYFSKMVLASSRRSKMRRKLGPNAPFRFDPGDWEKFFAASGWKVKEMRYLVREGLRIGRRPPSNWIMRVLYRLVPEKKRRELEKMMGYAVLERVRPGGASGSRLERGSAPG
jgi:methyltransferase (TIGR00027 family)